MGEIYGFLVENPTFPNRFLYGEFISFVGNKNQPETTL